MASPQSIAALLEEAASLLDRAAGEIRDAPLDASRKNILHIAQALGEIFEIQLQIYAQHPQLEPAHLKAPLHNPAKALSVCLERVKTFEALGETKPAVALLRQFLDKHPPDAQRSIAEAEIARLESAG